MTRQHRPRRPAVSRGRLATVQRMIASLSMASGRLPTDDELARLLATSADRIRRAREKIMKDRK